MINKKIKKIIDEMFSRDQRLRLQATPGKGPINYLVYVIDGVHNYHIHKIINEYGYPTKQIVGKKTLRNFWLLIQHQDLDIDLQEKCLANCGFNSVNMAFLTDRILVKKEGKQLYGTQFKRVKNTVVPQPLKDKKNINKLRKKVGISETMESSIKKAKENYKKLLKRKGFSL